MNITKDIYYIGVNDYKIDLFESQYIVPNGMAYNSYIIKDEKISIIDTVEKNYTKEWLDNIKKVLNNKKPDYLILQHMEPDHSSSIKDLLIEYPNITIIGNIKTFKMIKQFYNLDIENKIIVNDKDNISLGKHNLTFIFAPMVHWPEVMLTYDSYNKILFSADAFGKFGALDKKEEWIDEARRYYFGIVGKYGIYVQNTLKKISNLNIEIICPLHGEVLKSDLKYYIDLYDIWSRYDVEEKGIIICYTSIYGNTKQLVLELIKKIKEYGYNNVYSYDLSRCDIYKALSEAFKYKTLILATTTYNNDIFPDMKEFINHLIQRNYSNRIVGFIENGSWSPVCIKIMKEMFLNSKNISYIKNNITLLSSINIETKKQIDLLAKELITNNI